MKTEFEVKDHGLTVDKMRILPGSILSLNAPAPSHWQRFGKSSQTAEKKLTVATPKSAKKSEAKD